MMSLVHHASASIRNLSGWEKGVSLFGIFLLSLCLVRFSTWLFGPRLAKWRNKNGPLGLVRDGLSERREELATALEQIATDDGVRLSDRVLACVKGVEPHLLLSDGKPHIDFTFEIINGSVLPVEIGFLHDGLIRMDKTALTQLCQVSNSAVVNHGDLWSLTIRQFIDDQDANEAVSWIAKNDRIPFDFRELNVWMKTNWKGFQNQKARLKLGEHHNLGDFVWLPTGQLRR